MALFRKCIYVLPAALAVALIAPLQAQQENQVSTQTLVAIEAKTSVAPSASNVSIKVDNRSTPLISINRVVPAGAEVALLIDDGLRVSVGRELESLRKFVSSLPPGTSIFIGYMQNGRVVPAQNFTDDFAAAAQAMRVPLGSPGLSASPYLCLSDFVKKWPSAEADPDTIGASAPRKARFVLMITDGVDPYNGSTSITNQDSPYVAAAVADAQRSGVPVYSIYFSDAGIRGGQANFSGQSYLSQIAEGTGGRAYYTGTGNPVSMTPFLEQFKKAVAETYVATFDAPGGKNLVRLKLATNLPGAKLQTAAQVRPGTRISN
jgi:hypothetical protein